VLHKATGYWFSNVNVFSVQFALKSGQAFEVSSHIKFALTSKRWRSLAAQATNYASNQSINRFHLKFFFLFFFFLAVSLLALRRSVLHTVHRQTDAAAGPLGPSSGARVPFVLQGNSPLFLIHHVHVMNPAGMAWRNKTTNKLTATPQRRRKAIYRLLRKLCVGSRFSLFSRKKRCVYIGVQMCFCPYLAVHTSTYRRVCTLYSNLQKR
jgi:hypothetical protein